MFNEPGFDIGTVFIFAAIFIIAFYDNKRIVTAAAKEFLCHYPVFKAVDGGEGLLYTQAGFHDHAPYAFHDKEGNVHTFYVHKEIEYIDSKTAERVFELIFKKLNPTLKLSKEAQPLQQLLPC